MVVPVHIESDSPLKFLFNLDMLQICHRGGRAILKLTLQAYNSTRVEYEPSTFEVDE